MDTPSEAQRRERVRHVEENVSLGQVTEILSAAARGDAVAPDQLWVLVYDDLRAVARRELRNDREHPTLQTTMRFTRHALAWWVAGRLSGRAAVLFPARPPRRCATSSSISHVNEEL